MPNKEVFYERASGSLGEPEDWFSVIFPDGDGPIVIEHEWSRHNPYHSEQPDVGTKEMSVNDFLSGEYSQESKDGFKKFMDARRPGWSHA
jgi:hypothetical protein